MSARHPDPRIDAMWRLGEEARTPLICSAGRAGFFIDGDGDYFKCGAISGPDTRLGNIFQDGEIRFARTVTCERFPTRLPNPGVELQCWCAENRVMDVTQASPVDLESMYETTFVHVDVSRLCNYSCHYCTVSNEVFQARNLAKKREHLPSWARKPYMDKENLELIGRELFAKCKNIQLRIAGMMEPLMNPDILVLFDICRQNIHNLKEIRLMSNLGIEKTFENILDMGFGSKLNTVVSMHITDDNFDPFRVVRQIKRAEAAGTVISSHIVPSPIVREKMADYLDFFSLHGVRVRPVPYILEDSSGRLNEKGTQTSGHVPKHYPMMKQALGDSFAQRFPGKSYASYVEQLRSINADTYRVLEMFVAAECEPQSGERAKHRVFMMTAQAAPPQPGGLTAQPAQPLDLARLQSGSASSDSLVDPLRREALTAMAAGAPEKAFALLEAALDEAPEHPDTLGDLANLALSVGEYSCAKDFARQALDIHPAHLPSLYVMGIWFANEQRLAEACDCFERVLNAAPGAGIKAQIDPLDLKQGIERNRSGGERALELALASAS